MEFPTLTQRCNKQDCKQLDFLPINCAHCKLIFCKDHLSPWIHECSLLKDNILSNEEVLAREKEKWQIQCTHLECKVKDLLPMLCSDCRKHFCLAHRHPDQHGCVPINLAERTKKKKEKKVLDEKSAAALEAQNKVKEQINSKLEAAKVSGGANAPMAKKLALMKLKGRSKGDNAVPQSERLFFSVTCPNTTQNPKPLDLFMSRKWTMGKIVDFIARQARIKNRNDKVNEPKLHIFKDDFCLSTPFSRTLDEALRGENNEDLKSEGVLLEDGDSIFLKYVSQSGEITLD